MSLTSEFYTLAAKDFYARLAQANLVTKTDFDANFWVLTERLLQINQNFYSLKTNWKSWKHLIRVILLAKVILEKMVHKLISVSTNVLML